MAQFYITTGYATSAGACGDTTGLLFAYTSDPPTVGNFVFTDPAEEDIFVGNDNYIGFDLLQSVSPTYAVRIDSSGEITDVVSCAGVSTTTTTTTTTTAAPSRTLITLGYDASVPNDACADQPTGNQYYIDALFLPFATTIYTHPTNNSFADPGFYADDADNWVEMDGNLIVDNGVCTATTTTTTTTTAAPGTTTTTTTASPSLTEFYITTGYVTSLGACGDTTGLLYAYTSDPPTAGNFVFTDPGGGDIFIGNNDYIGFNLLTGVSPTYAVQINLTGEITDVFNCPAPTTTTAAPGTTTTASPTTTAAPGCLDASGPLSFNDLNVALGNSPTAQLDLETAAIGFSIPARPHGMDEFYGLCGPGATTAPPPTTTIPPTTEAPSFFAYTVNYAPDAGSGDITSCNGDGTNVTVYSNCSPVTLGGSCFLYNTPDVTDPAPNGWYSDASEAWYVESAGLVEDIIICPGATTAAPPSTTLSVTSIGLGYSPSTSTAACDNPQSTYYIDGATLTTANIIYTDTAGTFASQGYYSDGVTWVFFNTSTNTITDDGACPSPPTTAAPTTTTTTTTTTTAAPLVYSYSVAFSVVSEIDACSIGVANDTVYSTCSSLADSCVLYNEIGLTTFAADGWYHEISSGNYYYVEGNGFVEESGTCAPPTTSTTTLPAPTLTPWDGSPQAINSATACASSATNVYGFLGLGATPSIGDTCFTTPAGGKALPAGWYLEGNDFAAIQIGAAGEVIDKVLC
jgi:hypothetical protein